ncbi:MAG: hypothetical protein Rhims3KO_30680 [Hyphomicrobiales bacterium]
MWLVVHIVDHFETKAGFAGTCKGREGPECLNRLKAYLLQPHTKGPSLRRALSVFLSSLNAANRFQIRKNV